MFAGLHALSIILRKFLAMNLLELSFEKKSVWFMLLVCHALAKKKHGKHLRPSLCRLEAAQDFDVEREFSLLYSSKLFTRLSS
jgi:hypothetical protein